LDGSGAELSHPKAVGVILCFVFAIGNLVATLNSVKLYERMKSLQGCVCVSSLRLGSRAAQGLENLLSRLENLEKKCPRNTAVDRPSHTGSWIEE